ncbi:MAG: histidine phosphatase family protein [Candidatus Micrarchaeia archaeon]
MEKSALDFSGSWKGTPVYGSRAAPTLYVFRHGQSFFNRMHYFTGWKDSKLTPLGVSQARKIGRMLKTKKIDVAFVTSLSRSKDTMAEVLGGKIRGRNAAKFRLHPECGHIFTDDRMIERSYGRLSGTSHEVYKKTHGSGDLQDIRRSYSRAPPGGESIRGMVDGRVGEFLTDLVAYMKKHRVNAAISAHGNSIRALRKMLEGLDEKKAMEIENPWDSYFEYRIR